MQILSLPTGTIATIESKPVSSARTGIRLACRLAFLTYKPFGGTRDEFGGYEIDPVISYAISLSGGGGMERFDEANAHRQVLGKGVHR
jgi:hypothetical protein